MDRNDAASSVRHFSPPSNYDELIRDYGDLVKWCVARVCKQKHKFNDTLQECYVKLLRMDLLSRYSTEVPDDDGLIFKGYLRTACMNTARTIVSRDLKRRAVELDFSSLYEGSLPEFYPIPSRQRANDHMESLARALMLPRSLSVQVWSEVEGLIWAKHPDLAPRLMEVLRLFLLGYSDTEISEMFSISPARVGQDRGKITVILTEYSDSQQKLRAV